MKPMSQYKYHYGLKVRIYPSDYQKQIIKVNSDASRFVYNEMVGINQELYQLKKVKVPITLVQQRITQLGERKNVKQMSIHFPFLENPLIDSLAKANAVQNYQKAWNQFRKVHTTGMPNFHRKSSKWHYQTNCQYIKSRKNGTTVASVEFIDTKHVKLPKLKKIRFSASRKRVKTILHFLESGRIGTVTVSKGSADYFYASFQLASDVPFVKAPAKTGKYIGIDLNTENFLTDSNGQKIANPRYYRTIKNKLAKAQRKLSRRERRAKKEKRKLRLSKNYQKQRIRVAKLHVKVARQRRNFLQNLSTTLIKNHDFVSAEELRSKNMLKNHALAMSISDVGWRSFLSMLDYKADLYQRTFITVDPRNTTQQCYTCGFIMGKENTDKLTLADREWICPNCGTYHIRDHNAAQNILKKGLTKVAQNKKAS